MAAADIISEPGVFVPILISLVLPFILLAINKFSRTADSSITSTVKLEGVRSDVSDIKENMKEGFDKIENLINRKEEQNRSEFLRIWNRIEEMNVSIKMNTYKIEDITKKGAPI